MNAQSFLQRGIPVLLLIATLFAATWFFLSQNRYKSPSILVVGDSQISFGSGQIFLEFLENFEKSCSPTPTQLQQFRALGNGSVAAIGVRGSSLDTWTAPDEAGKAIICEVDKKWGVNAGVYGIAGNRERKYVQIGQGEDYRFCSSGRTPFQDMFARNYYNPDFLVMAFLGNATERWAKSPKLAQEDVAKTMQQIPANIPCVFMTTAPSYSKEINDERMIAQANIKKAFAGHGNRCSFVEGYTPQTRAANEGNSAFFATGDDGKVNDPLHPSISAQRAFFGAIRPKLCKAVIEQLGSTERKRPSG